MYGSYNTQKVLQDERIREMRTDAQPHKTNLGRRVLSLLSRIRNGGTAQRKPNCSHDVSILSKNPF